MDMFDGFIFLLLCVELQVVFCFLFDDLCWILVWFLFEWVVYSIYLYGSVVCGEVIMGCFDFDLILVLCDLFSFELVV